MPRRYISIGGFFSGFLGGLSGSQGMVRSAFLINAGLGKEEFIGTGVVCAAIVDVMRIGVYGWAIFSQRFVEIPSEMYSIIGAAATSALIGVYVGSKVMMSITSKTFRVIVGSMLLVLGFVIALGIE
jgi:uncharacterized membrane protein YfcA